MEPLDSRTRGAMSPSSENGVAPGGMVTAKMATVAPLAPPVSGAGAPSPSNGPSWTDAPRSLSPSSPGGSARLRTVVRRMAPWRIAGAVALTATFAIMGWQVQRLIDDQSWSNGLMWASVVTGAVAASCVLGWTWITTANARRLVEPAVRTRIPDPSAAVLTWLVPFGFVGFAIAAVGIIGARTATSDVQEVSALPLAVAVVALLLAIPMTYRPLHHLAGVVQQVGGYTVRLAQWMWVPVVMALVGIASIVALRFAGVDDTSSRAGDAADAAGWAPLWVIAVVGIAPCVIVVLLAWRAAASVEEAIRVAALRRRPRDAPPPATAATTPRAARRVPDRMTRIELLPGAELLRLVIATLVAGLALLSIVGALATFMLWLDSGETGLLPAERDRTWDTLDALQAASTGATIALLAAASAWSFVIVLNVRVASGRRRNPVLAAVAWPVAGGGVWWIADRLVVDGTVGQVVLGFGAQALVLLVPFLVLERSAEAIEARRTPLRIVYALVMVLLVHVQGLGGLSRLPDSVVSTTDVGRLAGYLALGALILLCTTLAVTEACRSIWWACRSEADHHNLLVAQHPVTQRSSEPVR